MKEGDYIGDTTINDFLRLHPEHKHRKLSIDGNGNIVTGGGAVLAVPGPDGCWIVKNLGGRPTADRKPYNLKVRLSENQYQKITDKAIKGKTTRGQLIRDFIDGL